MRENRPTAWLGTWRGIEWPTLLLIGLVTTGWCLVTAFHAQLGWAISLPMAAIAVAWHSSLQHEILHGHPTAYPLLNEALVFPALGLWLPYRRFRSLHLAHHRQTILTDPRADPESHYLTQADWARLPRGVQWVMIANNTLAGRMVVGPAILMVRFGAGEIRRILAGEPGVAKAWLFHLLAVLPVVVWLILVCRLNPVVYFFAIAYPGLSLTGVRTYAEHRANPDPARRTIIVEGWSIWALLFLNNSLHAVHHRYPGLPWYRLRDAYQRERAAFWERNGGYVFTGYWPLFRAYFLQPKEPIVHPGPSPRTG